MTRWITLPALALLGVACRSPLTEGECDQLLDRYTEKLMLDENPKATPATIVEKQAAARLLARQDPVFEFSACARKVGRSQFECAMQAGDVDSIERCLTL